MRRIVHRFVPFIVHGLVCGYNLDDCIVNLLQDKPADQPGIADALRRTPSRRAAHSGTCNCPE